MSVSHDHVCGDPMGHCDTDCMGRADKSPGQLAYEADIAKQPTYHDGTARKQWDQLCEVARYSWEKDPTPRSYNRAEIVLKTLSEVGEGLSTDDYIDLCDEVSDGARGYGEAVQIEW